MREPKALFPCPACGFLTRAVDYFGSYLICSVCRWEDDGVQLANPVSGGGANRDSLAEHQRRALGVAPLGQDEVGGFHRDPRWRPLSLDEIARATQRRADGGHWNRRAVLEAPEAYWLREDDGDNWS